MGKASQKKGRKASTAIVPVQRVERAIAVVRGQRVMLSSELAKLYGVQVKVLMQAVKRNIDRFPDDFMFQLTQEEADDLKSQIVTSSWGGARRARPYAFTEQGIAMLSAVLRSPTAVAVSIEIVRVFVRLRQMLSGHEELRRKLESLETKLADHDEQFGMVFEAIRQLMDEDEEQRRGGRIGFETERRARE